MTYRRPGVYLEESLLVNPAEGVAPSRWLPSSVPPGKGPINEPTPWSRGSDYVTIFGGFGSDHATGPCASSPRRCHTCLTPSTRSSRAVAARPTSSGRRPRPTRDDQGTVRQDRPSTASRSPPVRRR